MKAIIIAAGLGSRLLPLTEKLPKSMLPVDGIPMLQRSVNLLRENGIEEIAIITGHCHESLKVDGPVAYFYNDRFKENNILHSLFYAKDFLNDETLIIYSDIIYQDAVIKKIINNNSDFSVVVDIDWKKTYVGRIDHPVSEAEVVGISDQRVDLIGKGALSEEQAAGEFIGMMKVSALGAQVFIDTFEKLKSTLSLNESFQSAKSFEKSYLTDFLQDLINRGYQIDPVIINGGWMEIDTNEDYENAQDFYKGNL